MKRILNYVGIMNRGGMETLIMNIYRNIDRSMFQLHFATHTTIHGDFDDEICDLGGEIFSFPTYRTNPRTYRKTWREFFCAHQGEYTAFHFHTNSLANVVALEEATRARIPIRIVHSHSSFANKGKLQKVNNILTCVHRWKLPLIATHLFACSSEAAQWLYGSMQIGNKKVIIIKNGIECRKYEYNSEIRNRKRIELGLEGKKVVGNIGKFIPAKNHEFIIDILKSMINKDESVVGVLIGSGDLYDRIREKISKEGLDDKILLLGVRTDISDLLMAMDLYLMTSLYEGLPVSMIEAQASGVPALISDTISHEVKLKSNVTFYSLAKGSKEWADCALRMMDEGRIIDNSYIREVGFDIKSTVMQYVDILCGVEKC